MSKEKIYIAGKITGDKNYREKFLKIQNKLETNGYIVLNPAMLPEGMTAADYMKICFAMIEASDKVFFLHDHLESKGAVLEEEYCKYIRKSRYFLNREGQIQYYVEEISDTVAFDSTDYAKEIFADLEKLNIYIPLEFDKVRYRAVKEKYTKGGAEKNG